MPVYRFKARTARGRKISGEMKARDEADLVKELKKIGLELRSAREWEAKDRISLLDILYVPYHLLEALMVLLFGGKSQAYDPQAFQKTRKERADIRARVAKGNMNKMPTFAYLATTAQGNRIYGEMEALDKNDLFNRLKLIDLQLVKASSEMAEPEVANLLYSYKVPMSDLAILADQMEIYFRLDMVMPEILDAVRIGCGSKKLKKLLLGIRNHVAAGDDLYAAIRRYPPQTFGRFFTSLIEVGCLTGKLSGVMMYGGRHLKWLMDFQRNFVQELRWLVFSFLFIGLLLLLMMGGKVALTVIVILGILYALVKAVRWMPWLEMVRARTVLALPWIGPTLKIYDTLNFTYLFSIMWEAGLTAEEALGKAKHVMDNAVLREAISDIEQRVHYGEELSIAFAQSELFEPMVVMAFRQGETTGRFEAALDGVYYFHIRMLETAADRLLWFLKLSLLLSAAVMVLILRSVVHS